MQSKMQTKAARAFEVISAHGRINTEKIHQT